MCTSEARAWTKTLSHHVMIKFNAPSVFGPPDSFLVEARDGRNALQVSEYFLDASVSGEGALVTYFQT